MAKRRRRTRARFGQVIKREREDGSVAYQVRVQVGTIGGTRKFRTQTVGSEDEADHLLAEWKKERRRGTLQERDREQRARDRATLDEVVRWYLDSKRGAVSKKTHVGYRQLMDLYLPESLRAVPVRSITPEMIQAHVTGMAAKYKPRTIHSFLIVLRMALRYAVKRKLITESPAADVQRPRIARRHLQTFTVEQIKRFLAIADDDENAAYWRLAVETGMRPSEMIALRWSDLQNGVVHVQRARTYTDKADGYDEHEPKTATSRRQIRLSPSTLAALKTHKAEQAALKLQLGESYVDSGYVFARWDGRPVAISSLLDRLQVLLKDASLPRMRLYDLRHVAATLRLLNGERPKVVSEMLGHSSINITMDIYSHVMPDMQEESAARYEALMAPAPRPRRVRIAK